MKCQVINLHIAKCSVRKPIYIFPNSTPGIPGILLRSAHHEEDYPYQHNSKDCFSNFSSAYKQRDEKCISVQPWEMHFKREEVIFCKMGHEGWGIFFSSFFVFVFELFYIHLGRKVQGWQYNGFLLTTVKLFHPK